MKKLRGSLWAKVFAIILLCACALTCVLGTLATAYLYGEGIYDHGYESTASAFISQLGVEYSNNIGMNYFVGSGTDFYDDTNFRYTILDSEGETIKGNYEGEPALWEDTVRVTAPHSTWREEETLSEPIEAPFSEEPVEGPVVAVTPTPRPVEGPVVTVTPTPRPAGDAKATYILIDETNGERHEFEDRAGVQQWEKEHTVLVHGYVLKGLPAGDAFSQRLQWFDHLYAGRGAWPWIAGASFLLGLLLVVFLLSAAGHRDETDAVTPNVVDRLPWDVVTAVLGFAVIALIYAIGEYFALNAPSLLLCMGAFLLAGLLFLLWCMSTATRLKLGTLVKGCLLYKLLRWVWKLVKALFHALGKLPLVWKWALGVAALAFVDLLWRMGYQSYGDVLAFGWLLLWLLIGLATCYAVLAFRRLRKGAAQIAAGDESASVDTKRLIGDFKAHAEDLNNIRAGLSRAVDERMKSERFKTELITNVSHDIKTPLTSIVSYVDLLSKEELANDKAKEYIEVLQRQSARLKKLIEDLMEASKASTGNLPVALTRCELGVLLEQTAGEYAERLEAAGLKLITEKPNDPVTVMADGRHLWRIFDNLMSNICKYAQSGTRVYLSLTREGSKAAVTFRNISREPIKLEGTELTERFVRGDSARSTEGSGLGLAIAQSLAQLQGGDLAVTVDGDLFKVTLRFPVVE